MSKALDRSQRAGSDPIQIGNTKLVTDSNNDLTVLDTSSNPKKLIASEVHLGTGSDKVILKRSSTDGKLQLQTTDGSSTTDSEVSSDSSSGSGTTVYANITAMTSVSSPSVGSQALVTANKGLYIYNGSGWYKIATVNTSPTISSPSTGGSFAMDTGGTATSIELVGADADEGTTLQNSYAVTSGSLTNGGGTTATITTSATSGGTYSALAPGATTTNRFFKITPTTNSSYAGSFSLTFSMSDGTNAATTVQSFSLQFAVSGSLYFDGTGDYLSIADTYNLGSADWTIEFWVNFTNFTGNRGVCQLGKDSSSLGIMMLSTGKLRLLESGVAVVFDSNTTFSTSTWYHIAITNNDSSNTQTMYVNGVAESNTGSKSTAFTFTETTTIVGGRWYSSAFQNPMYGYISNFRVVAGSMVYTSNFTPSASPLTAITNTKLLLAENSEITSVTNGSYLFNAEAENLLINHADMALGSGDWTIDFWFQIIGTPSSNNWFFSLGTENADGIQCYYLQSTNRLNFWDPGGTGSMAYTITNLGSETGEWYHVRFCRNGNNHYVFINGNCIGGAASNGSIITSGQSWTRSYTHAPSSNNCRIGTQWSTGYGWEDGLLMSDFRIIKGTSLQTSATGFAKPTTPSTAVSGTVLLTCQNSTGNATVDNSGTSKTISIAQGSPTVDTRKVELATTDQSGISHSITEVGDTRFSHVTPFINPTGGSTDFIGATGTSNNGFTYIDSPVSSAVSPGNGDFTIEYWVNSRDISAGVQMPFDYNYSTASGLMMYINTSGRLIAYQASSFLLLNDGTGSAPLMASNTWYHVALCRNSGQLRMYQNGILCTNTAGYGSEDGSHPFTTNLTQTRITIGVKYFGGHDTYPVNGSISNFRLVVGTAVYTGDSSFTPPTSPLTAITNTQLLTCQNSTGTIADASSNNLTMIVGYGAIASKHNPF